MTPDDMLATAKQWLRDENMQLLAMIEKEKALEAARGRLGDPNIHKDRVQAKTTDIYKMNFKRQEKAAIFVKGDGDCDLDLYIYDENGNLVGRDIGYGDVCRVTWSPIWTGTFIVKIKNIGSVYANYYMISN